MLFPFISIFLSNDTTPTAIYTLSLHDALPISGATVETLVRPVVAAVRAVDAAAGPLTDAEHARFAARDWLRGRRSEEHTSELQSRRDLVCRLLPEKKKQAHKSTITAI